MTERLAVPMRKREKQKVEFLQPRLVELFDDGIRISRGDVGMDIGDFLPRAAIAEQAGRHQLGMRGAEPQQLASDIARGTKDGRPNHGGAYCR
jgi:hypothetical protein